MSDTVQTEFGPIDRRTRKLAGYLIMGIAILMAVGFALTFISEMPDAVSPNNLIMVGIAVLLCIGIPHVAIFGEKEKPPTARARPSPPPPSYDTSRVSEPQQTYQPPSSDSDYQGASSYESAKFHQNAEKLFDT